MPPPAQKVATPKFYAIQDSKKQEALQLLFPSVQLEEQGGEIGFIATPSYAILIRGAIAAHLEAAGGLENKITTSATSASQDWLPKPVTGLLYGLAAGAFTASLVAFPLIQAVIFGSGVRDHYEKIRDYDLMAFTLGTFMGGTAGTIIGVYQSLKDRFGKI